MADADGPVQRVAIAVFLEVPADDEGEAMDLATAAVRKMLGRDWRVPSAFVSGYSYRVVKVMEVGQAAGNGYLWPQVTAKAFREAPRG